MRLAGVYLFVGFLVWVSRPTPSLFLAGAILVAAGEATRIWAAGHLLANGTAADLLLFGGFLVWAVASFRAAGARDRLQASSPTNVTLAGTVATLVVGAVAWAVFALYLHAWLFGVQPFVR